MLRLTVGINWYHRIPDVIDETSHKPRSIEPGLTVYIHIYIYISIHIHIYKCIIETDGKFHPITAMKTYKGSRGIELLFL
jgi:hypothetical protein